MTGTAPGGTLIEVEESIVVSLPRERVFEFAALPENMPLWNPVVRESKALGALERGTKVVQRIQLPGRRFETVYEVTCYEPGRRIAYSSTQGPVEVEGTMEFRRERGGTRVRWIVRGDARGFLRFGESILVGLGRPKMRDCLHNLKRAVEERAVR
jgi:uncharacterized membrane protein